MIPGDLRLIESKDLFISQSLLTGEAIPVEKYVPFSKEDPAFQENQRSLAKQDRKSKGKTPLGASQFNLSE
jgi:magnesium-transporting ATPase (P-type)